MTRNERLKEMYNDSSKTMRHRLVALLMSESVDSLLVTNILDIHATIKYFEINSILDAYEQEGLAE